MVYKRPKRWWRCSQQFFPANKIWSNEKCISLLIEQAVHFTCITAIACKPEALWTIKVSLKRAPEEMRRQSSRLQDSGKHLLEYFSQRRHVKNSAIVICNRKLHCYGAAKMPEEWWQRNAFVNGEITVTDRPNAPYERLPFAHWKLDQSSMFSRPHSNNLFSCLWERINDIYLNLSHICEKVIWVLLSSLN